MEIAYKTLEGCTREVEMRVPETELQPKFDEAFKEHQPKLTLKGFRKGKVPMHLVKQMFGEAIEQEMLQNLANEEFKKLVEDKTIQPIGMPVLRAIDYKHGGDAVMKIAYEVKPEVKLADFHGLKAERLTHEVTGAEVEAEIERQRYLESTTHVEEEVASDEYIVTMDVQQLDEATQSPVIGSSAKGVKIYLKRESVNADLKAALMNKRVGDTVTVRLPEENSDKFQLTSVTVKAIEHVDLPEMTEEFVKRISDDKCATYDEYKAFVKTEMQRQWDERSDKQVNDAIADEYVRLHNDVPVPIALVEELLNSFVEEYKRQQGKMVGRFNEQEFREQMTPSAVWQARWMLVREALMEQEHLAVDDSDVEDLVKRDHQKLGIDEERLRSFYKSSDQVREKILVDKVFKLLRDSAVITNMKDTEKKESPLVTA